MAKKTTTKETKTPKPARTSTQSPQGTRTNLNRTIKSK